MTIIGRRIAARRKELGLSQRDVASKIGVSQASIQRYESGTVDMPMSRAADLAEVLHCTLSDLTEDIGESSSIDRSDDPLLTALQVTLESMSTEDRESVANYMVFLLTQKVGSIRIFDKTELGKLLKDRAKDK